VVGNHEHRCVVVGEAEETAELLVQRPVVVERDLLVPVAGLVPAMKRIEEMSEAVLDPVGSHLDHEEEIPGAPLEQVLGDAKALLGHLFEVGSEPVLLVRAKVANVRHVVTDEVVDLVP